MAIMHRNGKDTKCRPAPVHPLSLLSHYFTSNPGLTDDGKEEAYKLKSRKLLQAFS